MRACSDLWEVSFKVYLVFSRCTKVLDFVWSFGLASNLFHSFNECVGKTQGSCIL